MKTHKWNGVWVEIHWDMLAPEVYSFCPAITRTALNNNDTWRHTDTHMQKSRPSAMHPTGFWSLCWSDIHMGKLLLSSSLEAGVGAAHLLGLCGWHPTSHGLLTGRQLLGPSADSPQCDCPLPEGHPVRVSTDKTPTGVASHDLCQVLPVGCQSQVCVWSRGGDYSRMWITGVT